MAGSIQKRGKDTYLLRISNGFDEQRKRKYYTKTVKCSSLSKAKTMLAEFETEIRNGFGYTSNNMTFKSFIELWLKDYCTPNLSPKTVSNYKSKIDLHILPKLGCMKLQKITPYVIQRLYTELSNKEIERVDESGNKMKLSSSSIHKVHEILSSAFNCAVKWKYIPYSPLKDVAPPKVKKARMEFYDEKQCKEMLNIIEKEPLTFKVIVWLAITTGLRRGEILGLHWSDVDFENCIISVNRSVQYVPSLGVFEKTTKTESSIRRVPVPVFCLNGLKELREEQLKQRVEKKLMWKTCENIFVDELGQIIHPDTVTSWFRNFIKRANLPQIKLHGLRHTCATILLNNGVNVKVVSNNLGHSNLTTTNRYLHAIESANKECAKVFEELAKRTI